MRARDGLLGENNICMYGNNGVLSHWEEPYLWHCRAPVLPAGCKCVCVSALSVLPAYLRHHSAPALPAGHHHPAHKAHHPQRCSHAQHSHQRLLQTTALPSFSAMVLRGWPVRCR